MRALTVDEVALLAHLQGIELNAEDLLDATLRLNVLLAGLDKIKRPDLDRLNPIPFPRLEESPNVG